MVTANTTIRRAYNHLRKTTLGGNPSATESAVGLETLNAMLSGWVARGVDIGHRTLTGTDTINVLPENEEDVSWMLASRLAPEMGVDLAPAFQIQVDNAWSSIRATYWDTTPSEMPKALTDTPSSNWAAGRTGLV